MKTISSIIYLAFALFAFACFALVSTTRAVNPPPDGGYPGLNTAEGQSALFSLDTSTGNANTAVGWFSLKSDVKGVTTSKSQCTARTEQARTANRPE